MRQRDEDLAAVAQLLQARLATVRRALNAVREVPETRPVSDHALVRYMERVHGVDTEAIRDEIRSLVADATPAKDAEHHWHPSGVMFILGDKGQVITVLGEEQVEKWIGRKLLDGTRVELEASR